MIANATFIKHKHGNKLHDNATYVCNMHRKINGSWINTTNATCMMDDKYNGVWINVPTCEST